MVIYFIFFKLCNYKVGSLNPYEVSQCLSLSSVFIFIWLSSSLHLSTLHSVMDVIPDEVGKYCYPHFTDARAEAQGRLCLAVGNVSDVWLS